LIRRKLIPGIAAAAAFFAVPPAPLLSNETPTVEQIAARPLLSQPLILKCEPTASAILPSAEPSPALMARPPEPEGERPDTQDGKVITIHLDSLPDQVAKSGKEPPKKQSTSPAAARRHARLAREALSYRGTPYRWGGGTPRAFDCSGFTQYLYARQGIKLPHKASLQFRLGEPVARDDLRPGDLVFFNTTGPLSHVGMYIGDGKFVHAANPRKGVIISSLVTGFYARCYAGARRYSK